MALVSVIIPNYNHAAYLRRRIESVLNQTVQDFELIILDDCSTDNSKEIIEKYSQHPKVTHLIFNDVNSGSPFIQWQQGIALAAGEFIWIAESDDYAHPSFLEELLPCFNKSVGVVYCDSNLVDADNVFHPHFYKEYRNSKFSTTRWNSDYSNSGLVEIKQSLFYECTINNTSAMVFRKHLIDNVYFEKLNEFRYCGDWFFFISIVQNADISYKRLALNNIQTGTNNFKKGTRSVLNYFKERFLVRYYLWENINPSLSEIEKCKLYRQLGREMQLQINEVVKKHSNLSDTLKVYKMLFSINKSLFASHLAYTCKAYMQKLRSC